MSAGVAGGRLAGAASSPWAVDSGALALGMFTGPVGDYYPDGILEALGNVVTLWSNVEAGLAEAIVSLGHLTDNAAARIMLSQIDARGRIGALKSICFIEMPEPDFSLASSWLNAIDNELRNSRNRFIHDQWESDTLERLAGKPSVSKRQELNKIVKAPSTGLKSLETSSVTTVEANDIFALCYDLSDALEAISLIGSYLWNSTFADELPPIALRCKS